MAKITVGKLYKVTAGSGLHSGKIGRTVDPYYWRNAANSEPGRYKPFDGRREAILRQDDGTVFTMFKNRLEDIPCKHPPARLRAWYARDDTMPDGEVLCVVCCDCGAILREGVEL